MKFILPRVGKRLKKTIIGSGKIKRRIKIYSDKHSKKKRSKSLEDLIKRKSTTSQSFYQKKVKVPIQFSTSYSKMCFNYWNSLGHPFVMHKPQKTKQTARGLNLLDKAIKNDGKNTVIRAMNIAKEVFNSRWFTFYLYVGKRKLSLSNFFLYNDRDYKHHKRGLKNLPRSWYKECLKGIEYMKENYSTIRKDLNPEITKELVKIWKRYSEDKITIEDKNKIKRCGELVIKFSEINNVDIDKITEMINNMLNEWKTYKPSHVGYLTNKIFWNKELPKEFVRSRIIDDQKVWVRVL